METFFGNIFGVLLVIAIPIGFILFIQLMSKISGKRIARSGQTMARPNDFDESIETIKKASEDLSFNIKKFKLDNVEQVVYKLDKVLKKAPGIPFKNYYISKVNYENLFNEMNSRNELTKNKSNSVPLFDSKKEDKLREYKNKYKVYLQAFDQSDLVKIESFITPVLNDDFDKLIEFLDKIGMQNFKEFASVIDLMEKMYLSSKITKEEINNIKLLILRKKGMLNTII